jgi:hypothetical protein
MLSVIVLVLIVLAGGWALVGNQATSWEALLAKIAAVSSSPDSRTPPPGEARAVTVISPPAAPEPAKLTALDASLVAPPPPLTTAAVPPPATPYEEPPNAPSADPADPHRMRAEAVGLHPGLSRVLLERLSPTDYRNAGFAIRTALAETPDSGVFVWPRQREPELALFQVRFVKGAAPGCRRYVVTITKDRWSTTALPMERCGPQLTSPRRE